MAAKSSDWRPGPTVCRCCFAEGCYKDISTEYFWMGKREVYAEMLSDTFDVSISYSQMAGPNSNSRLICEPCISRLRDASDFKRQVLECEKTFIQYLDPGRIVAEEIEAPPLPLVEEKDVKLERVKEEEAQDDDDFDDRGAFADDDDDLDDEPLMNLATKIPKNEVLDDSLLTPVEPAKPEKRKCTTKAKASPAKKAKKKEAPKPSVSKPAKPVPEKKKKASKREVQPSNEEMNAIALLRHSTAYPFYPSNRPQIICPLCTMHYKDPLQFRTHIDTDHQNEDKSVAIKPDLTSLVRVDITDLRCKACPKTFQDLITLAKHLVDEHSVEMDLSCDIALVPLKLDHPESFACIVCSEKFSGLVHLSRHTGTHFGKCICEVCGKNYETNFAVEKHVMAVHNQSGELCCKICKKVFKTMSEKKLHHQSSNECLPLRCHICKTARFKSAHLKDKHLNDVHGKPNVYRCVECKQTFPYKVLYYSHFRKFHTEINKCEFCDERCRTPSDLRTHIRRKHTGERPFECKVCRETFYTLSILNRHSIKHDDSKKFSCSFCGQLFLRKYNLTEHINKAHS